MPVPLTVRNLTRKAIILKKVEHIEVAKRSRSKKVENLASNFASLLKNCDSKDKDFLRNSPQGRREIPSSSLDGARCSSTEVLDLVIKPWKAQQTPVPISGTTRTTGQVVRLCFKSDHEEHYFAEVPPARDQKQSLKPSNEGHPVGDGEYTTIFSETSGTLAILDAYDSSRWMQEIPDDVLLSVLSIPGTHNSPTCYKALPSVRCQAISPATQLENGIRFLDVRVQVVRPEQPDSDVLHLVHGSFSIALSGSKHFRDLLNEIYTFLDYNPSETIILCLKREGCGNGTDAQLADRLHEHYVSPENWHVGSSIPELGRVRGKIVLMRRFHLSARLRRKFDRTGWGIDATDWEDNTANHRGGEVQIQDFYEATESDNINKKTDYVRDHLGRAGAFGSLVVDPECCMILTPGPLFINFLSASNFWKKGCWPEKIAAKLNPAITAFLCERHYLKDDSEGYGCTGVVVCDWVGKDGDWDLVKAIIGMNSRMLVMKEEERLFYKYVYYGYRPEATEARNQVGSIRERGQIRRRARGAGGDRHEGRGAIDMSESIGS